MEFVTKKFGAHLISAEGQYEEAIQVGCTFCGAHVGVKCDGAVFPQYPHTLRLESALGLRSGDWASLPIGSFALSHNGKDSMPLNNKIDLAHALGEAQTAVSHLKRIMAAVEEGRALEQDVIRFVSRTLYALSDAQRFLTPGANHDSLSAGIGNIHPLLSAQQSAD